MSNIYITEPNTEGKVLMSTSFGDLDIELWPKQAPKAVRNFIQLAMEHYYDDTIFHRLISSFMIQGGDPLGTGDGGESIYGKGFETETHSRIKFNHRGQLAMANTSSGSASNHSQFFFTLDKCEFLNDQHTIFGKVTGNTIFNLLSINALETDSKERPKEPPRIHSITVLWNPFEDIVPRQALLVEKETKVKRKGSKKKSLLSFNDENGEDEEEVFTSLKKVKSSHDVIDPTLSKESDPAVIAAVNDTKKLGFADRVKAKIRTVEEGEEDEVTITKDSTDSSAKQPTSQVDALETCSSSSLLSAKAKSLSKVEEYKALRAQLATKRATPVVIGAQADAFAAEQANLELLTPLQVRRKKYLKQKRNYGDRQKDTLAQLTSFKEGLLAAKKQKQGETMSEKVVENYHGQIIDEEKEEDNGEDWKVAELKFKKHIDDQYRTGGFQPTVDDYVSIDTKKSRQ